MAEQLSEPGTESPDRRFTAVAFIRGSSAAAWVPALDRLLETPGCERLLVSLPPGASEDLLPIDERLSVVARSPFSVLVGSLPDEVSGPTLLMTSPTMLPLGGLGPALDALARDARVASVSFLSNAAGHLSFPQRNRPTQYSYEGHDETTMTRLLRRVDPELLPAPIVAPAGGATLVSRDAIVMTKGPDDLYSGDPEAAVVDMVMRAQRRGLKAVLDPATFVGRLYEGSHWGDPPLENDAIRTQLQHSHPQLVRLHQQQKTSGDTALGLTLSAARAKVRGLRILVDGSCLGPIENGTQVQTLALIEALARRDDVKWVGVGFRGGLPRYAERVLSHPKVRVIETNELRFPRGGRADILHRPFQPTGRLPWTNWRGAADRVVVTLQDLIAYSVGAYHERPKVWMTYRRGITNAVAQADGLVVISNDVGGDLLRERLPAVAERTFVVENGTDHLTGHEPDEFPAELFARGWAAREFLVVLGANYAHKNRDIAIRVFKELRERHPSLGLVLAGVAVAEGSSRVLEAIELRDVDGVVSLPDVTSRERNWLLRHAAICLYPSSNEGFGLVPFEAARFGTPTVFARVGPLAEVLEGVPVAADSWDPVELADCCDRLLEDPQLAAEQVTATLKCGDRYTWDETAAQLVRAYRGLLARPSVR